ncbi:hypothetical protein DDW05_02560 [Candidatus Nanobsidianus stetteri]|uniref:Uncharacterized protein n=1 Tax=Nanobsidianus stetteri TaxID=1294122 RepID=A0A2T9WS17_NANST|nr:hypothetical protein DDW05_02560 [Candidatus Nanobsidianus stetteri]
MSEDKYDLDLFIKNSFEETIEYLNKIGIKIEGIKLKIMDLSESFDLLQDIYGDLLENIYGIGGIYASETREIRIIKNALKRFINRELNNPNKIFIGNLFTITHNSILYPVYKNDNDIEKAIAKAIVDPIVIHEIGHDIIGQGNWRTCIFEFLVYFYKNELYKYPEVYKIMEQNIEICKRHLQEKNLRPTTLGACFANDFIYIYENLLNKDKQSPKLNIKDTIEKLKYFSEDEYMDATKMINTLTKILILLYK